MTQRLYQQTKQQENIYTQIIYMVYTVIWCVFIESIMDYTQGFIETTWLAYVVVFLMGLLGFFVIDIVIKKLFTAQISEKTLIIDKYGISTSSYTIGLPISWTEKSQILLINNFKDSSLAKISGHTVQPNDTAFIVIEDSNKTSSKPYILSTLAWKISDIDDLVQFFDELGYPIQTTKPEQIEAYFPALADLGNKSGFCAISSIFWMLIAIATMNFDDYRTLDYGFWIYIVAGVFLAISYACFKWINETKTWVFQLVVSLLFASTFTLMLSFGFLVASQSFPKSSTVQFQYKEYGFNKGVTWQQVDNPEVSIYCGDKSKHDKGNNTETVRQATVISVLGIIRVKHDEICLK